MARRQFLGAGATLLIASDARAQSGLWPEWLGSYSGAVRFYRSIPLEDIYPPPEHPHVDLDSAAPFAVYFSVRAEDGSAVVWLRIDGGPMQTTYQGETLRFAPLAGGFAALRKHKPGRRLDINVEYYTALLLEALEVPRSAFTALFAVGRTAGWCAHIFEQEKGGRIIRPQSNYVGPRPQERR